MIAMFCHCTFSAANGTFCLYDETQLYDEAFLIFVRAFIMEHSHEVVLKLPVLWYLQYHLGISKLGNFENLGVAIKTVLVFAAVLELLLPV